MTLRLVGLHIINIIQYNRNIDIRYNTIDMQYNTTAFDTI